VSTPDDDNSFYEQYALYTRPLITHQDDNLWRAQYPGVDWYITADTEQTVREKLHEEIERRLDAGETNVQPSTDTLERHLANPIPGCAALDRDLFVYLRDKGVRSELTKAFEESERRRALGQTYTKADYLAEHPDNQGDSTRCV
jgi:hypothetical protein